MKKRILIILFVLSMLIVGCGSNGNSLDNNSQTINNSSVNVNDSSNDITAQSLTLEKYLGIEFNKINATQRKDLQKIIEKINKLETNMDESDQESLQKMYANLDEKIKSYGLTVPFRSYADVVDYYSNRFTEDEKKKIIELDEAYIELMNKLNEVNDKQQKQLDSYQQQIDEIITKAGLPAKEIFNQVDTSSIHLALFDVKNGEINLSSKSSRNSNEITKESMELYKKMWMHIKKIIPVEYMSMLNIFAINTDGYANTMAFVSPENDDLSQWRLVIDLKDALNTDGTFNEEFTKTVVHEFAHVITLNKTQMQDLNKVSEEGSFQTQEGTTSKESYINQFFQKFWKDIYEEHQELTQNANSNEGEASYEFYEKYRDRFVSDYAATNPGEDIAETYRVFVLENKPEGSAIKDQKVLFMYQFDEFVKIREEIRKNLGLI